MRKQNNVKWISKSFSNQDAKAQKCRHHGVSRFIITKCGSIMCGNKLQFLMLTELTSKVEDNKLQRMQLFVNGCKF